MMSSTDETLMTPGHVPSEKTRKKLLIALDQTEQSKFTFDWALEHCAALEDLIILCHAYQVDTALMGGRMSDDQHRHLLQKATDNASLTLKRYASICQTLGYACVEKLTIGDARHSICEIASTEHVDYVVVGSRGKDLFKRALLGSVSDYCVSHLKCPVVVVRDKHFLSHDDDKSTRFIY